MKLRCILIEDERPARELLETFISRIEWLNLIDSFKAPLEIEDINWNDIDILFTDIEMGELSGIDYLKTLPKLPYVIITTAYSEHALEGYELDIVDYLLKPFSFDRFLRAVNKVKSRTGKESTKAAEPDGSLVHIQADRKTYRVSTDEIIYIEGMREYAGYHLNTGEKILELVALKNLETSLSSSFLRIHKSYIVNTKFIKSFDLISVELKDRKLPIGKNYRANVKLILEDKY